MSKKKVVFLDRDGTVIYDKIYLNDPEQIEYIPGCFEGLQKMKDLGFEFVIVTNQSGIPRGLVDVKNLEIIHQRISDAFRAKGIEFLSFHCAPYSVESGHPDRKPGTGMLDKANQMHKIDMSQSWMIGDRMTDVECGHRAGCKSILLSGTEGESPEHPEFAEPEAYVKNLIEAAEFLKLHVSI